MNVKLQEGDCSEEGFKKRSVFFDGKEMRLLSILQPNGVLFEVFYRTSIYTIHASADDDTDHLVADDNTDHLVNSMWRVVAQLGTSTSVVVDVRMTNA